MGRPRIAAFVELLNFDGTESSAAGCSAQGFVPMVYIGSNKALRITLDEPIETSSEHQARVSAISSGSIEFVSERTESSCFAYAFDLLGTQEYVDGLALRIAATSRFVRWLLEKGHLEAADEGDGRLVIYFDNAMPTHAGVEERYGRIRSQWGGHPVYRHALDEVPASYGNDVEFFKPPSRVEAAKLFKEYREACSKLDDWAQPY